MPEGDSLRRAEALLSPLLNGQVVTEIWFRKLRGHRPRAGQRVERVEAVGKHLLIHFDPKLTLRTHLGMSGSWSVAPADREAPQSPRLRVLIRTAEGSALCFSAPTIDTFIRDSGRSPVGHLGPDLSNDELNIDEVVERSRELANDRLVAELLLDQRVAAGVGNVFKSEVAFLAGVHPFTTVSSLDDDALAGLWRIAHRHLLENRDRPSRRTTARGTRGRYYVYDRFRLGCHRCSNAIRFSQAGSVSERSTYWCPTCQGEPSR